MKFYISLISILLIFLSCNFIPEHRKDDSLDKIRKNKVIYVGQDISIGLPFTGLDRETKNIIGFEVDIARYIGQKLGVTIKIVNTPWKELLNSLEQKKFDIALNLIELPEDKEILNKYNFSLPYYYSSFKVVTFDKNTYVYGIGDLKNKKVGVIKDTTPETLLKELNRIKKTNIKIYAYQTLDEMFNTLKLNKLDAIFTLSGYAEWFALSESKFRVAQESLLKRPVSIVLRKEDKALFKEINNILKKASKDSNFKKIFIKWGIML